MLDSAFVAGRILCVVIQSSGNVGICMTSVHFMVWVKKVAMQLKEIFSCMVIYFFVAWALVVSQNYP